MSTTVARGAPPRTKDGRHALAALSLPAGSNGPKADASVRFSRASGHPAAIGRLTDAADVLAGHAGTTITPPSTTDPSGAEQR